MRFATAILATAAPSVLGQECSPLHLIYGRATGEPSAAKGAWSKGYGAAGFSLLTNITKFIPGTTGYPVNYPANGDRDSTEKGAVDMLNHITQMAKACPAQKYVLGGHSQGGNVTFHAIPRMAPGVLSRIVAVTMFGSPACPSQVADRCNSYCYKGDFACNDGVSVGKFGLGGTEGFAGKGKGGKGAVSRVGPQRFEAVDAACAADVNPKGYVPKVAGMPHMVYNTDGYYVRAAACYVASQYKKLGGSSKLRKART